MAEPKPKPWTRKQKQAAEDKEWANGNSPIETTIDGKRYKVTPDGLVLIEKTEAKPVTATALQQRLKELRRPKVTGQQ